MTDEYTPTTEQVRAEYVANRAIHVSTTTPVASEFDRWLAAHEAGVRERIAEDIKADMNHDVTRNATLAAAARIARGATR